MLIKIFLLGLLALVVPSEPPWAADGQSGSGLVVQSPPEGMVLVPAGSGIEWWEGKVIGKWRVKSPFFIDKFEITVGDYFEYLEPKREIRKRDLAPAYFEQADLDKHSKFPVVGVTWRQALLYCKSIEKRLPTNVEWMMASLRKEDLVAGPGGTARFNENVLGKNQSSTKVELKRPFFVYDQGLTAVGSDESDVSAYGVKDMGGSVSEWVEWTNRDFPTRRIFGRYSKRLGSNFFLTTELEDHGGRYWLGFRCAKDVTE